MTLETSPRSLVVTLPEFFVIRRHKVHALPSANSVTAWNFGRQRFWLVELKRIYALYILKAQERGRWGYPAERVEVEIVRRCARLFDGDNVYVKAFLDTLKAQGIVVDDSPKHLTLAVHQERAPIGSRGVSIVVRESGQENRAKA